jgi:hypothetical protein
LPGRISDSPKLRILYGLESADGYEIPNVRARHFSGGLIEERDDAVFYEAEKVAASPDRRLDMLNVKYWLVDRRQFRIHGVRRTTGSFNLVFKEGSIAVFENKHVLSRMFAVPQSGVEIVPNVTEQLTRIRAPRFDPEKTVYFAKWPATLNASQYDTAPFTSDIRLLQSDMNSFEFRSRTSGPAILVLSQIYYPGWRAAIDGKEVPVAKVDCALMGIVAPEGEHAITFFFRPRSFRTGTVLSSISLLVLLACVTPVSVWKRARLRKIRAA